MIRNTAQKLVVKSCIWLALAMAPCFAQQPAPPKPKPAVPAQQPQSADPVKPAGPELVAETYGDWVMRCQQVPDGRRCEVVQSVTAQGQAQPIALIALGREKKSDPMRVVVQLPTNVLIESGVNLVLVNGDVLVKAVIRRCAPFGCFADTQIDDGTIGKLKAEKEPASVKFKDAAERDIAFPVSLRGFQPALEALMRI